MSTVTAESPTVRLFLSLLFTAGWVASGVWTVLACGDVGMGIAGNTGLYRDFGREVFEAAVALCVSLLFAIGTLAVASKVRLSATVPLVASLAVNVVTSIVAIWFALAWAQNNLGPSFGLNESQSLATTAVLLVAPMSTLFPVIVWIQVITLRRKVSTSGSSFQWVVVIPPLVLACGIGFAYLLAARILES